ncbi:YrhB domain-containing protein [Streptomyces purpurogeneiscleroticus]|uniref:YrhB domain-containing protein n=1 Tax=Streptomyces purpurogeneiscleroticus TaxID=68259 RepID=UPI001CBF7276|nr:YrhB domain-containing protein [Streptomyces purpurogeneiscleroticus]MBZ4019795.1 serine protease [Streptomyces purpurogeneiscleroticus]
MVTKDEAVLAAEKFLKNVAHWDRADSVVMLPDTAKNYPYAWTVQFDFQEHIDTGDMAQAPFSGLVVVPHDGSPVHFAPSFPPPEEYLELQATGNWPPK